MIKINNIARVLGLSNQSPAVDDDNPTLLSSESANAYFIPGGRSLEGRRGELRKSSQETLDAIKRGRYELMDKIVDLSARMNTSCKSTKFYGSDSALKEWPSTGPATDAPPAHISVLQISTLDAARLLEDVRKNNPNEFDIVIGVLNFASATKPGGAFQNGTDGQEQSIARSSTLHATLVTSEAQQFYKLHSTQNNGGYYSHGMIYSPKVTVFRDDDGRWGPKYEIDVVSSAAVNVNMVLNAATGNKAATLVSVEKEMKERMARILFLFERNGVRNIILGAFGTGTFDNDVATVARLWAQLLIVSSARFKKSFDRVIFAIMGKPTYDLFNDAFMAWKEQQDDETPSQGIGDADELLV